MSTQEVVGGRLCRHLHPLEWTAPIPRQQPCDDCVRAAIAATTSQEA